jgi:hypothetical protein
MPYSREYLMTRDNSRLLAQVAEQTGGRVLTAASLASTDLFDRAGLTQPRAIRQIWDILAIIAAVLLVIDVAARRLVFNANVLQDGLSSVTGVSRTGRGETIAAWKRARAASVGGTTRAPETAPPVRAVSSKTPSVKTPSVNEGPVTRATEATRAEDAPRIDEEEPSSPLSRLRRAKRKAMDEMDGTERSE